MKRGERMSKITKETEIERMSKGKRVRVSKGNVGRGRKKEKVRAREGCALNFSSRPALDENLFFPPRRLRDKFLMRRRRFNLNDLLGKVGQTLIDKKEPGLGPKVKVGEAGTRNEVANLGF